LHHLIQDLRYGLRTLRKNRSFTLAVVLTLAVGIGANSLVFSVVEAVLVRPLPFGEADRLVMVWEKHPTFGKLQVAYGDFFDLREQNRSFEQLAAYSFKGEDERVLLTSAGPQQLQATVVSQNLLSVLGTRPQLGRDFAAGEDQAGHDHVAIISDSLWRNTFGADPSVIGRSITLGADAFVVIGVMPREGAFPEWASVWLPLSQIASGYKQQARVFHPLQVVGRLKPGVSLDAAQSDLLTIAARLQAAYPATNKTISLQAVTLEQELVGNVRPVLLLLLLVVSFVLLIACINVANLLLARSLSRQKEFALRSALGASRGRVTSQVVAESLLLSGIGAALGLMFTYLSLPAMRAWLTGMLPRAEGLSVNATVLAFTFTVAVVTGVAFGLPASLSAWQRNVFGLLKTRDAGDRSPRTRMFRSLLVVGEVSLALVVLVTSGLLIRSLGKLLAADVGYAPEHVLTMKLTLPAAKYSKQEQVDAFFQQLLNRVGSSGEVVSVAAVDNLPIGNELAHQSRFAIQGQPAPQAGQFPVAHIRTTSPTLFSTLKIPLIGGRWFVDKDNSENVVVVNQAFQRRFLGTQDPTVTKVLLGVMTPNPQAFQILGVVGDVKDVAVDAVPEPVIYFPGYSNTEIVVVRTKDAPLAAASLLQAAVHELDSNQPIESIQPLTQVLAASLARQKLSAVVMGAFSLIALALAAIGIYGVMAYQVTQRTREIAIRMALGAGRGDVLKLVIGNGMRLAAIGTAVGALVAVAVGRTIANQLYDVRAIDPATYLLVAAMLLGVAFVAVYVPSRRAANENPAGVLKYE
jgi:predicted permease